MQLNDLLIALPSLYKVIDRYPLTINADSCVMDAIVLMSQEKNHSLETVNTSESLTGSNKKHNSSSYILVVEQRQLLGIFTSVDVLRLTALGRDLSKMTMAQVMTKELITVKESDIEDICTVLSIFQQHQLHQLPIVDERAELVGIVTESRLLQEFELLKICSVIESIQQHYQDSKTAYLKNLHFNQQEEEADPKTDNLASSLKKKVTEEIKNYEKIQETIEEMQILEEELRQQNEQLIIAHEIAELERRRYQNLFEFTPYGYLVTNKLGIIQEANYAASTMLSVEQKYLVGKPITIFIVQEDRHELRSLLANFPQVQEREVYIKPQKGKPFPASMKISALYDPQGKPSGWICLLCNISERKQAEIELNRATEELELRIAERTRELVVTNQALQQEIKERKEIETALRKSEEIFRQFGANVQSQIIWIKAYSNGETVYVNPAYEKIWGRSCQSLWENPMSWIEAIHPEDRDRIVAETRHNLQKGEFSHLEYRLVKPDGSIGWIFARCFPIKNEQGQIQYIAGIAEDITERKLADQSLRQSEERLTLALEAANMGIWDWDITTGKCIWSDHVGQLYGLPKGSLSPSIYQDFLNLIHPEDRDTFTQAVNLAIEKKTELHLEYRAVWPDGSLHWLQGRGKVYYHENGQPRRMVGTTKDISDRKQKEQKIYEQAALLDIATDAIFVRDFQTEILFWNQGAERIYGWSKEEVLGKNLQDIFCPKNALKQEVNALKAVVKLGTWQGELRKQTKSGKAIIVESRWTLIFDAEGQPQSILVVDTDITEKKQLEEQFLRTQRLESIGTLASGIAHDLNNTLTPVLAAAQLLRGRLANDYKNHPHLLSMIENNAKHGSALVKQVLSFARGLKGEQTIVQVKHLITEIIQISKQTFSKAIKFNIQIPENLWTISGDATQIYQVFMNLVVNARDAMPEGGLLTISAENIFIDEAYARMHQEAQIGHYIVITISDTGTGIPPEILERIFEPFFTTKEIGVGTGLGLSTVMRILKSHNGFLRVSSQVDKGSTFKVFLPSAESPQIPGIEELEIPIGKGEVILVVDDEPLIQDVAKIILENHNYQTLTASNGIEAIALYAKNKQQISAVLMDMMMPEMDGVTAIHTMQKMNPKVQVIACSGLDMIEILPTSADTKVQGVLLKPYTANDLLLSLNQVIGNRSLESGVRSQEA